VPSNFGTTPWIPRMIRMDRADLQTLQPRFEGVIQELGPQFCPSCQIDLFTNPHTSMVYDPFSSQVVIKCDCQKGAYRFTAEQLDDMRRWP
jgi:hypothetical protein